jgi:hypothetical protein
MIDPCGARCSDFPVCYRSLDEGRKPMTKKRKAVKRKKATPVSKKKWSRPVFKFVDPIMDRLTDRGIELQPRFEELTKTYQSEGLTLKAARQRAKLVCLLLEDSP